MQAIGKVYIMGSSFSYDVVIDLPNIEFLQKPEAFSHCTVPKGVDIRLSKCDVDINSIRIGLQAYNEAIYTEVNEKIAQIFQMLPLEYGNRTSLKRGIFDGLGIALKWVGGVATSGDLSLLQKRLSKLEGFIADNEQGSRIELERVSVIQKLTAARMDEIVRDVKHYAMSMSSAFDDVLVRNSALVGEVNLMKMYMAKTIYSVSQRIYSTSQ